MTLFSVLGLLVAGGLIGWLAAGRFMSIRLYPQLSQLRDDAVSKINAARAAELDLSVRKVEASSQEWELQRAQARAAEAEEALASYLAGPDRQRVMWLAQQLAAHLSPAGVAALVGREERRVDAERQEEDTDGRES